MLKRSWMIAILLLILVSFSFTPGRVFAGGENPPLTDAQQRRADRIKLEYEKLRTDINDLNYLYERVGEYRTTYFGFLTSEQYHQHDTQVLVNHLYPVDSFLKLGAQARQNGMDVLSDRSGFDGEGNVVDINKVGTQVQNALSSYLTSRNYAVRAAYYMHSALNLYHQITGLATPSIPDIHLEPYYLASAVTGTPTPAPLTDAQKRLAGRLASKATKLKADLADLQILYDKAASYRAAYTGFLTSEQYAKHDTKILDDALKVYDYKINHGIDARQQGLDLLNGSGFDADGNVININTVDNAVRAALTDFLTSRNDLVSGINYMHSALNRYHQVQGVDVPDVPKLHLAPYLLTP